jgi:cytochrome P450
MRALLRYIVGDKRIYNKVMSEIEEAVEEGNLNFPLTYAEGTKLSYFQVSRCSLTEPKRRMNNLYQQACLKETLRLHPAVPWTLPRVVPEGGAVLAGHYFPAGALSSLPDTATFKLTIFRLDTGTQVAMDPFVFHRRTEAFGEDAAVFRPERWLEADDATKKVMERNLITFGRRVLFNFVIHLGRLPLHLPRLWSLAFLFRSLPASRAESALIYSGSRVCIGKNISLMEITKVVPTLLHKYEFTFTARSATSPHTKPGRRVDGTFDEKEPWHCTSQWVSTLLLWPRSACGEQLTDPASAIPLFPVRDSERVFRGRQS